MRNEIMEAIKSKYPDSGLVIDSIQSRLIAEKWSCEPFALPSWDSPIAMEANLDLSANYFFFGNLINFGFVPYSDSLGPVGCNTFWLTLRSNPELMDPANLMHLSKAGFTQTFGHLPFSDARINLLHAAARTLRLKYNGKATELYEVNHWNALEIIQTMYKDFPGFQDVVDEIYFMRKALLTLFMTHARFQESNLFSDLNLLYVGADLQVFNGLLQIGVIQLEPQILQALAKGPIINAHQETTLRCASIWAADALLQDINQLRRDKIDVVRLDHRLRQIGTMGRAALSLATSFAY